MPPAHLGYRPACALSFVHCQLPIVHYLCRGTACRALTNDAVPDHAMPNHAMPDHAMPNDAVPLPMINTQWHRRPACAISRLWQWVIDSLCHRPPVPPARPGEPPGLPVRLCHNYYHSVFFPSTTNTRLATP
ncbi:MAG: hypothetical protein K6U11_13700 [bacterium]|nr:hypothetical protein [bacterium]